MVDVFTVDDIRSAVEFLKKANTALDAGEYYRIETKFWAFPRGARIRRRPWWCTGQFVMRESFRQFKKGIAAAHRG